MGQQHGQRGASQAPFWGTGVGGRDTGPIPSYLLHAGAKSLLFTEPALTRSGHPQHLCHLHMFLFAGTSWALRLPALLTHLCRTHKIPDLSKKPLTSMATTGNIFLLESPCVLHTEAKAAGFRPSHLKQTLYFFSFPSTAVPTDGFFSQQSLKKCYCIPSARPW